MKQFINVLILTIIISSCENIFNDKKKDEKKIKMDEMQTKSIQDKEYCEQILKVANYYYSNNNIYFVSLKYIPHLEEILWDTFKIKYTLGVEGLSECEKHFWDSIIINKYNTDVYNKSIQIINSHHFLSDMVDLKGYYSNRTVDELPIYEKGNDKLEGLLKYGLDSNIVADFDKIGKNQSNFIELLFHIDSNGITKDVTIYHSLNSIVDRIVLERAKKLKCKWSPAIYEGKHVPIRYYFVIEWENPKFKNSPNVIY